MKCAITGVPTNIKWKNIPLAPGILELAKQMKKEDEDKAPPGARSLTMRECLSKLEDMWRNQVKQAINEKIKKAEEAKA